MRQPFDQLAKRLLRAVLSPGGAVDTQREIAGDALEIDTLFRPDPARAAERRRVGLLGRMSGEGTTLFEAFHAAPTLHEYRGAVLKQLLVDRAQTLEAEKQALKSGVAVSPPPPPRLWLLCALRPRSVLDGYELRAMHGYPNGFYERASCDAIGIVVLRQLPRDRGTLLLRLLGRGPVLVEATEELRALPDDAWERTLALPLLIALRLEIPQDPTDASDREFLMNTAELYDYWKEHYKQEGVERGIERGIELGVERGVERGVKGALGTAYEARFGPVPAEVEAAIAATHDPAILSRWLQIIVTRTPAEIATEVCGTQAGDKAPPRRKPKGRAT